MRHIDAIKIYQRKSCLIIDDMSEVRGGLKRMLQSIGMNSIDTAANAEQATELCQEKQYDLVLCDYNLGAGQDGQQILEALRYSKLLKNSSIFLMITAETSRDMVLGALEYQPDDYLTKPITERLLQTRLSRIVLRHEQLLAIKQAIDTGDLELAIDLCQQQLDAGGKYSSSCRRIQAELLLRLGRLDRAEDIYSECLGDRDPVWAKLGLGKTRLAQRRFDEAESLFRQVIEFDTRFVEAHDLLAQLYAEQADYANALLALRSAAELSPKSVLRQRRLANMARLNKTREAHDELREIRIKARRSALKFGEHSCHYSPQDYFDVVADLIDSDGDEDELARKKNARDAEMYIARAEKKHPHDNSIRLQAAAARARLASFLEKGERASKLLAEARAQLASNEVGALAKLELAQAMSASDDHQAAAALIARVADENPDDEELAQRIDALSVEPASKKGRQKAADLTRKGIRFYEQKNYDAAIEVFQRAISLFPNHTALRLNITQAALAKARSAGRAEAIRMICQANLDAVDSISRNDRHYPRYQHLVKEANNCFGAQWEGKTDLQAVAGS